MALEVSESTLYPVLRRLLKDGRLEAYDMEYAGRNRRYYRITPAGWVQLEIFREEWGRYTKKVAAILGEAGPGGRADGGRRTGNRGGPQRPDEGKEVGT